MVRFLSLNEKTVIMKAPLLFLLSLVFSLTLSAQDGQKAKTTSAVRLFEDKDDLASVITIIPSGGIVEIVKGDGDYILVNYDGNLGYIQNGNITYDQVEEEALPVQTVVSERPMPESRYDRLVMKYGDKLGRLFYQNKIWKGLTTENVLDSWGKPLKINKTYNNNDVEEEWVYSKKWLLFRNDVLVNWGAVKQ